MRQSATAYFETGTFQEAAAAVTRAWRKQYGYRVPPPALSHALSDCDGTAWRIVCAETGQTIATVREGMAALTEERRDNAGIE